jgi:hypothetical protein
VVQGDRIFTLYSVQLQGGPVLRRRYSQFLQLYQRLTATHHGSVLHGFRFPKKQLTNNFRPDVLEERRAAFRYMRLA